MAAYSSTSFGIVFVSIFKIFNLRPLRRRLLLEAEAVPAQPEAAGVAPSLPRPFMNRSILIVICDFLLVSLLAFSTADINKTTNEGVPRQVKTTIQTNPKENERDLTAVMRLALEQEHKGREQAARRTGQTREAASGSRRC